MFLLSYYFFLIRLWSKTLFKLDLGKYDLKDPIYGKLPTILEYVMFCILLIRTESDNLI